MYKMKCNTCGYEITGAKHWIFRNGKEYCIYCRPDLWSEVMFKNMDKEFGCEGGIKDKKRDNSLNVNFSMYKSIKHPI